MEESDPVKKRILEEYDNITSNPSNDFIFRNVHSYEWQGALRGPAGTDFEGGIYHVRLLFRNEYLWKEPSFIFLTENGSFKIQTKVRVKRESSRTVRHAFLSLIESMPKCPDFKSDLVEDKEKRRDLAKNSRAAAPIYGTDERQKLIDLNHKNMGGETRNTSLTQRCEVSNPLSIILTSPPFSLAATLYFSFITFIFYIERGLSHSYTTLREVVVDRVGSTQMESDRSVIVEDISGEKRILKEYDEIESKPSNDFKCLKLDWNPYEWQFAIRGPSGTEFERGIYHGMVQFSEGYPSKPPSIMFLTENGCFDRNTSFRLSQSSLSLREILVAFIEEMATYPKGGLVSEENRKERRRLAKKSCDAAPQYGGPARQQVIDDIHKSMRSNAQPVSVTQPSTEPSQPSNGTGDGHVVYIFASFVVYNFVRENIINASKSKYVGIMDAMNVAPNAMMTKILCFMFFASFFCVGSYKFLT